MLLYIIILVILTKLYQPIKWLLLYITSQLYPINLHRYGNWAIITGASDGIGKAYALELAKRGLNICLISRTEDKLKNVCQLASKNYKVDTDYIVFDFKTGDYKMLRKILLDKEYIDDVGMLVNNVGTLPYAYKSFNELSEDFDQVENSLKDAYLVNMKPQTLLTAILLPKFYKRQRGILINISSVAGTGAAPFWTIYSCSKAFNLFFGQSIQKEVELDIRTELGKNFKNLDILSQVVTPGIVLTNMAPKFAKSGYRFVDPEIFAKFTVSTIGYFDTTYGYWFHCIMFKIYDDLLSSYGYSILVKRMNRIRAGRLRKKNLKKE